MTGMEGQEEAPVGETRPEWFDEATLKALQPGRFLGSTKEIFRLIRRLEGIQGKIRGILKRGRAGEALGLFWILLQKVLEKAPELGGSGGAYALFFEGLFCDWVRARQAAGADPRETARVYLAWAEKDNWGFFLDLHKNLVSVLDPPGFQAFLWAVRGKLASMAHGKGREGLGYDRAHWVEVLKCLLAGAGDAGAFLAFCRREGMNAGDFDALAGILEKQGERVEALAWVEEGLDHFARHGGGFWDCSRLEERKKRLLHLLGRKREVLALEWKTFQKSPCLSNFQDLMEAAPEEERPRWRERALAVGEKGSLGGALDLFLGLREWDRLARRVARAKLEELEELGWPLARKTAQALEGRHPGQAARIFGFLALSRLEGGSSRGYSIALRDFQRARDAYLEAGLESRWAALVEEARKRHGAKRRLMAGLEKIADGGGKRSEEAGEV